MNNSKITFKTLVMTSLLFMSITATAQHLTYGIKAGVNITTHQLEDSDYATSSKSILGMHVGLFGNYAINEKFAIQPELLYSTGGRKYTYSNSINTVGNDIKAMRAAVGPSEVDDVIKTSHLVLPVMLQFKIINGLYIEAGPQYSFVLSIKEDYDGEGYENIKEYYKSGTFGIGVGAGYDLSILTAGLKVGVRYTTDLSEMNKVELEGGNLKSSMFQVGLLYAFGN